MRAVNRHKRLREAVLVGLGAACFAAAFSYPTLEHLDRIGIVYDWGEHLQPNWAAFYTILHFRQIPLWNPYRCGGMPLLAHPLSPFVTPLFVLQLIFGPFVGVNLEIPVHIAIGWIGGYLLARSLEMGRLGGLTCASVFSASSWFYLHIAVGHLEYLPAAYMPWIAFLVWQGIQRQKLLPWVLGGLLLAITFGEGGVYQCVRIVLLVWVLSLYFAVVGKTLEPIKGMVVLGVFSTGFAALKLLPCWDVMQLHPRQINELENNDAWVLLVGLFTRDQSWGRLAVDDSQVGLPIWGFFELGTYVSPVAVALAVLGLSSSPRRALPWLLLAVLFFSLALGGPEPWYPWALIHQLPVISSERVPSRFLMGVTLPVGVIAGLGADFLARRHKPLGAILAAGLLFVAIVDAWKVSRPNLDSPAERAAPTSFGQALGDAKLSDLPPEVSPSPQFRQFFGSPWEMVGANISNLGAVYCNEGMDFSDLDKRSVLGFNQPNYFGEQHLAGPGSITVQQWTPNAISYEVDTPVDNVMTVNQNYDANWRLVEGKGEVFSEDGLIAVRLPAGAQHLRLAYRSYSFSAGAVVTLVTSIAALILWRKGL